MKSEFEKARDEAWNEWHYDNPHDASSVAEHFQTEEEFDEAYNEYVQEKREPLCFRAGADWAFEWCQEKIFQKHLSVVDTMLEIEKKREAQLDQQAKVIAELKGALKEASKQFECITYNTHNSYCVEELANDANEEIKQVIKQTDKPDEV